jgi:hypothetical protein
MAAGFQISRRDVLSGIGRALRLLTRVLVAMAIACSIGLLTSDTKVGTALGLSPAVISAAPLLLIGVSFLVAQTLTQQRWTELLKNVLLAAAFILWSVVQLMEQNALSKKLGKVVIALYVLDLAWVILVGVNRAPRESDRSLPSLGPGPM